MIELQTLAGKVIANDLCLSVIDPEDLRGATLVVTPISKPGVKLILEGYDLEDSVKSLLAADSERPDGAFMAMVVEPEIDFGDDSDTQVLLRALSNPKFHEAPEEYFFVNQTTMIKGGESNGYVFKDMRPELGLRYIPREKIPIADSEHQGSPKWMLE